MVFINSCLALECDFFFLLSLSFEFRCWHNFTAFFTAKSCACSSPAYGVSLDSQIATLSWCVESVNFTVFFTANSCACYSSSCRNFCSFKQLAFLFYPTKLFTFCTAGNEPSLICSWSIPGCSPPSLHDHRSSLRPSLVSPGPVPSSFAVVYFERCCITSCNSFLLADSGCRNMCASLSIRIKISNLRSKFELVQRSN